MKYHHQKCQFHKMKAEKSPHCPDADGEKFHCQIWKQIIQKGLQSLMPEHSASFHRKTVIEINFPR